MMTDVTDTFGLWLDDQPLILASTSRTRALMLQNAGIPCEIRPSQIDERALEADFSTQNIEAGSLALYLARAKALAVSASEPERLVLAGDQTLTLGRDIFHKPQSIAQARKQLERLSGQTHRLHSAAAVAKNGRIVQDIVQVAELTMRPLSEAFLTRYLALMGDSVCDSVGGYKLEGHGISLFEQINGDYFTILGLPLLPLLAALRAQKALAE